MHLIFFRSYMLSIIMICAAVSSSKAPFLFANFLLLPSSLTAASSSYTNTPFFAHLSLFPRRACEYVCARAVFRQFRQHLNSLRFAQIKCGPFKNSCRYCSSLLLCFLSAPKTCFRFVQGRVWSKVLRDPFVFYENKIL